MLLMTPVKYLKYSVIYQKRNKCEKYIRAGNISELLLVFSSACRATKEISFKTTWSPWVLHCGDLHFVLTVSSLEKSVLESRASGKQRFLFAVLRNSEALGL